MATDLDRSFWDYLKELRSYNLIIYSINIQERIIEIYEKKNGLSREQVFELPLNKVWPLIQNYEERRKGEIWINTKT